MQRVEITVDVVERRRVALALDWGENRRPRFHENGVAGRDLLAGGQERRRVGHWTGDEGPWRAPLSGGALGRRRAGRPDHDAGLGAARRGPAAWTHGPCLSVRRTGRGPMRTATTVQISRPGRWCRGKRATAGLPAFLRQPGVSLLQLHCLVRDRVRATVQLVHQRSDPVSIDLSKERRQRRQLQSVFGPGPGLAPARAVVTCFSSTHTKNFQKSASHSLLWNDVFCCYTLTNTLRTATWFPPSFVKARSTQVGPSFNRDQISLDQGCSHFNYKMNKFKRPTSKTYIYS